VSWLTGIEKSRMMVTSPSMCLAFVIAAAERQHVTRVHRLTPRGIGASYRTVRGRGKGRGFEEMDKKLLNF
jgi:hypothetical protein